MKNLNIALIKILLPPDPLNLLLIFMILERSLVLVLGGENALFLGGYIMIVFCIKKVLRSFIIDIVVKIRKLKFIIKKLNI